MTLDNQRGLEGGWAFLSRVTQRPMQEVRALAHRAEALVGLDVPRVTYRAAPPISTREST